MDTETACRRGEEDESCESAGSNTASASGAAKGGNADDAAPAVVPPVDGGAGPLGPISESAEPAPSAPDVWSVLIAGGVMDGTARRPTHARSTTPCTSHRSSLRRFPRGRGLTVAGARASANQRRAPVPRDGLVSQRPLPHAARPPVPRCRSPPVRARACPRRLPTGVWDQRPSATSPEAADSGLVEREWRDTNLEKLRAFLRAVRAHDKGTQHGRQRRAAWRNCGAGKAAAGAR